MAVLSPEDVADHVALGELGLDGSLAPVAGVLPAAMGAVALGRGILCPAGNGGEAAWAGDLEVLAAPNLLALINHFKGRQVLSRSAEHTSELQSLMRISYAVFCLKKKNTNHTQD